MNGKERVLALLHGKPTDSLPLMPITMMAAADFVGEKYGAYATDYAVLARGQTAIAEHYDFDYVSAISDPAVEAHDCGATIVFYDDQPPAVDERNALLADKRLLARLKRPEPATAKRMANRLEAVRSLKERVGNEKLVEGWIEGPCAEAADLRGINQLMIDLIDDPLFVRDLFDFVMDMEIAFAGAQIEAGADIIGVGDAAASLVGPSLYTNMIMDYERRYAQAIHGMGALARLHICGNTTDILEGMGKLGFDIVDIDSLAPFDKARASMGRAQVLCGNMDPVRVLRNGKPESVLRETETCWKQARPNYIVGAGCEVPRDTPEENLRVLTEFARARGYTPSN
jgi:MtaA/CmuA family methyltransferase